MDSRRAGPLPVPCGGGDRSHGQEAGGSRPREVHALVTAVRIVPRPLLRPEQQQHRAARTVPDQTPPEGAGAERRGQTTMSWAASGTPASRRRACAASSAGPSAAGVPSRRYAAT